jgi:hypothetical protein
MEYYCTSIFGFKEKERGRGRGYNYILIFLQFECLLEEKKMILIEFQ